MATEDAIQMQIEAVIVSQLKMKRTCSLIRRVQASQLRKWKYGKSQRWKNDEKERKNKTVHRLLY